MPERLSDRELVERALRGEPAAADELVARHYETAVAAAFSVLGKADASRDCAQEAFLEAAATLANLRDNDKFGAWIYGIAKRKAIYMLRRQKLHSEAMKVKTDESRSKIALANPSELAGHEEKLASIRTALAQVPGIYRDVLVLKYVDGRSHEQIAEVLQISLAAVDKRLMRGKDMLWESVRRWNPTEE
jgi:RNA polymerase sigma-70 factor (ECF subfamily)